MKQNFAEELEELKTRWLANLYWALESTAGFEAHREELRRFRLSMHARQEEQKRARLLEFIHQYEVARQPDRQGSTEST